MNKKSVKEIEAEILSCRDGMARNALFEEYTADGRKSVQNLLAKIRRADEKLEAERRRVEEMCSYEKEYSEYEFICGIDEAGRGPLAGPVVAGAAILPKDCRILYINDSKKLSAKKRDELFDEIQERALAYGVGVIGHDRIDEINILQATYEAMRAAIASLKFRPDILLNDAVRIPDIDIFQVPIIKGDAKSQSIAAASILAKVTRDRLMEAYAAVYPEYGFERNKGYGSAEHIAAIKKYGPCPIHRMSFIKSFI
ncbi:MAG TPA: ribonuclease HII [Candidatus Alectryocaccobium stercorigallinarum]|nr:ribonuclease HII [Candidatus Alectryocaccobium stercorigallinarum]